VSVRFRVKAKRRKYKLSIKTSMTKNKCKERVQMYVISIYILEIKIFIQQRCIK